MVRSANWEQWVILVFFGFTAGLVLGTLIGIGATECPEPEVREVVRTEYVKLPHPPCPLPQVIEVRPRMRIQTCIELGDGVVSCMEN